MCKAVEDLKVKYKTEGIQEGRQEGLQEGRQEGLQEGRQEGLQEGRQKGIQEGRQEGILKVLTELVKENILTTEQAAKKAQMSEKRFRTFL